MTDADSISVVIPNWNGRQWLPGCFDSLRAQTVAPDEIVLVDDGSTDDSVAFVESHYPEIRIIALPQARRNRGFCAVANAGVRAAGASSILLLNNDATLHPRCVEILKAALGEYPQASFFALQIRQASGDLMDSAGAGLSKGGRPFAVGYGQPRQFYEPQSADNPPLAATPVFGNSGGAGLYRRRLFEDVGLLDEGLFMYLEDVDLNLRARVRGHECLYLPEAVAYHRGSATLGAANPRVAYLIIRNRLLLLFKSLPAALWARNLPRLLAEELRAARFYAGEGRALLFCRATLAAILRALPLLCARGAIQKRRSVAPADLNRLLEP